jgi:phage antirepressor YoqD-like protein
MQNLPANEKLMTVDELSEIFSVHKTTILKYINKSFPDKIKSGIKTFLNEKEVTIIKLELQQNQHLSQSSTLPKTELEENLLIQQAQNLLSQRITRLQKQVESQQLQIEADKPKVEFHDQVLDASGLLNIGETAKSLGLDYGRNTMFKVLREMKIFFKREPYQKYINQGYFEVKATENNGFVQKQAFTTPKGLEWLQKKFSKA